MDKVEKNRVEEFWIETKYSWFQVPAYIISHYNIDECDCGLLVKIIELKIPRNEKMPEKKEVNKKVYIDLKRCYNPEAHWEGSFTGADKNIYGLNDYYYALLSCEKGSHNQ